MRTIGIEIEASYPIGVTTKLYSKINNIFGTNNEPWPDGARFVGREAWEIKSDIMQVNGFNLRKELKKMELAINVIKDNDGRGAYGSGVHVHVGLKPGEPYDKLFNNIVHFMKIYEKIFYDVGDPSRAKAIHTKQIKDIRFIGFGSKSVGLRYCEKFNTIEFRHFPSLPSYEILCMWVDMCIQTVEICTKHQFCYKNYGDKYANRIFKWFTPELSKSIQEHLKKNDKSWYYNIQ